MDTALRAQRNEITEHTVYKTLAQRCKHKHNKAIFSQLAQEELAHYEAIKEVTKQDVSALSFRVWWYLFLCRVFGFTFGLKYMEKKECWPASFLKKYPQFSSYEGISEHHEKTVLSKLQEERVEYAGSLVLGLNDALVELTGALAGLTFALQNSRIVAFSGIITGFAASLSMAVSEYLSSKEDIRHGKNPLKAAVYTGIAYIVVVTVLVTPYFVFSSLYLALTVTLSLALLVVASYTYYITTAKSLRFWPRFLEMALLSLSVAALSFLVGYALRYFFGIEI